MQINNTLVSSITKGLIISAVLIFFHVLASQNESAHTSMEIFKISAGQAPSDHQDSETKIVIASFGIHHVPNFEVVRDILLLLVVLFAVDVVVDKINHSIPIPLSRHFKILFSFFISPNAPPIIVS
jgi:hypothetical protein